jgi:PAS domain S-box-containing protein
LINTDEPHFYIVAANDSYLAATKKQSRHIVGKKLFEAFPQNPNDLIKTDDLTNLAESLRIVIRTKKAHSMSPVRYDTPIRGTMDFEGRYWQTQNIPVLDKNGEVELILHTVTDINASTFTYTQLKASETKYKELVQSMNAIVWEACGETYQYKYINPQAKRILGYEIEDWYEKGFWENHVHPADRDRVMAYSLSMISQHKDFTSEYRMIAKDKSVVWIGDVVSVTVYDGGELILRGVMTDITSKKVAEQSVLENRSKISNILKHSLDMICTVDAKGIFLEVSPACESILGYHPEELLGLPFLHFVHPDDVERSGLEADHIINGDYTSTFENRYIHKSGDIVNMLWSCKWDEVNQVMYCIAKDGTYKNKIERQLNYSEQRFKSLVQHGADFIAILDIEGNFTYVSLNSISILGYPADYLEGKNAFSLMHKDDLERVHAQFLNLVQGTKIISDTFRYLNGEGKYQWMEAIAIDMRDYPAVGGIVVNTRDVSEKKHYLEWHEYVNKATNNAIYDWDIIEDKVQWGGFAGDIFEASEKSDRSANIWIQKLHPEDRDETLKSLFDTISDASQQYLRAEYRLINSKGDYLDIIDDGFFIRNDAGEAIRMIGALRDVTEHKKFETEIQISNQRYALATRATSDVIWDWDITTDSLFWGEGFLHLFGHNPEELPKDISSWNKLIHPKDYKRITNEIQVAIDHRSAQWEGEYRFLKSDGKYVFVHDRGFIQRDVNGRAVRMVGAMQDIHHEKLKEVEDSIKLSINRIFTEDANLTTSFRNTLKTILNETEFSYGEIWLTNFDQENIALTAHYGKGSYTIEKEHLVVDWDEGMTGSIFKTKKHLLVENIQTSPVFLRKNFAEENGFEIVWGHPICFNNRVLGVILLYNMNSRGNSGFDNLSTDVFNLLGSEIQRKKAEMELNSFFDLSADFLCIIGMDGRFIKVNQTFESIIGPIKIDGQNLTYHYYTHPDDISDSDKVLEKLNLGQTTHNESRYRTKSGEYIWLRWDTVSLVDHGYIFTIGKDITALKKHKEELENSHAKLSETLESIQDGFFAVDFDWKVTYWNKEAERILNLKRENILGKNLWESFPEAMKLKFFPEYNRAMTDREIVNFEEYFPPLSIWFNVSAFPSENGMTAFFKDITEIKNESVKLLQFKKVFENAKDEIAIISTVNDDIYLNPAYTESLGYGEEKLKLLGGPQHAFASVDLAAEVFTTLLAGNHWKGDVEMVTDKRKFVSYHISGGPIFDDEGKLVAVFLIHTNISQRKEIESKLKDLYGDLTQQNRALAQSHEELTQFANVASHHLQLPINEIESNLQIIENQYILNDGLPHLQEILKNASHLQLLIKGLLSYTIIGNENRQIEKIDLNEVLADVNKALREKIVDGFAIIDNPKMPVIKGNKEHIKQIFLHLIDNSLTYSLEQPRIVIAFDSGKTHWVFSISDNGTGFDPNYVEQIFGLFLTLNGETTPKSKGMGLAITKKLVEKYKGKIWVETEPNIGSTFHFTISKDL